MDSGNHIVDQDDENRRQSELREGRCPHCGATTSHEEGRCTESCDHCEKNCQEMIDDHDHADLPEGQAYVPMADKAYLKCEFYRTKNICDGCDAVLEDD